MAETTATEKKYDVSTGFNETLKMNSKSDYALIFKNGESIVDVDKVAKTLNGNDLTLKTTLNVTYKAEALVTGSLWGNEVGTKENPASYTFTLAQLNEEQGFSEAYQGKYMWKADQKYADVTAADKTLPRYWMLDNSLFKSAEKAEDGSYTITEDKATATGFRIYKYIGGVQAEDVTEAYVAAAAQVAGATTYDDKPAKTLVDASDVVSTLVLKDYGKYGDVSLNKTDLASLTYEVSMAKDKTSFTGTRLNETIVSGEGSEQFNMGTGKDKITFAGTYGDDKVTANKDEKLDLVFATETNPKADTPIPVKYEIKGNDVVLTTPDVNFKAYVNIAKNTGKTPTLDGVDLTTVDGFMTETSKDSGEYTVEFTLKKVATSSDTDIIDTYQWFSPIYKDATKACLILENSDFAETADWTFDGITLKNGSLKVVSVVDGKEVDITSDYKSSITTTDNKDDAFQTLLLENSAKAGSVTITNYAKADNGSVVTVNGSEKLADHNYDVAMAYDEKTKKYATSYTGSWLKENIVSRSANEKFNMGTNTDKITFNGNFGHDTVTVNSGEELHLNFTDTGVAENLTFSAKGNDLVATADVSYFVTADIHWTSNVEAKQYIDSATGETDITGDDVRLDIHQYATPGIANLQGKYMFGTEAYGADGKVRLYLDNADFAATSAIHFGNTADTGVDITDIKLYREVNGKAVELDKDSDEYKAILAGKTFNPDYSNYSDAATKALFEAQGESSVTIKNFVGKNTGAALFIGDTNIYNDPAFAKLFTYTAEDAVKGKIKGSALDDVINADNYQSSDGKKGLNINSGSGNDKVVGTDYNDTVKASSLADQTAQIAEASGTNKVTFGKGNDSFIAGAHTLDTDGNFVYDATKTVYSSNTVNMGSGNNKAVLGSQGTNKLTVGNGNNDVQVWTGYNTVKTGKGANEIELKGGINTVTTGNGNDTYEILGGNNTVKSGAGADKFTISGGYNTINAGNGGKNAAGVTVGNTITITGGSSNITAGKNDDTFSVGGATTGNNYLNDKYTFAAGLTNTQFVNDSKGNDTYDFSAGLSNVVITDTKGANNFVFETSTKDFFFEVDLKMKKGNAVVDTKTSTTTLTNYKYSVGNDIFFSNNNWSADGSNQTLGVGADVEGRKAIADVQVGTNHYSLNQAYIDTVGQNVANWLATNSYASTADVFAENKAADVNALLALYADTSVNGYTAK